MINSPCYKCADRKYKCHVDCGRYEDYKMYTKRIGEIERQARIIKRCDCEKIERLHKMKKGGNK